MQRLYRASEYRGKRLFHRPRIVAVGAALAIVLGIVAWPESSRGDSVFDVNSPADVVDASLGDGVCETAPGNNVCTLRAAVQETNTLPGADTINLQGITYTLSIPRGMTFDTTSANGDLNILEDLTINGVSGSTINGNGVATGDRVFRVATDAIVSMSGFTITGGRTFETEGAAIYSTGSLTLDRMTLTNNSTSGSEDDSGGAIYSHDTVGASLTIIRSTISGNTGSYGGAISSRAPLTVRDSTISGNTATVRGGGIYTVGTTNIVNSTISGNHANENGGGIYTVGGTVGLHSSTVAINRANSDADDTPGVAYGGGVYVSAGTVTLANTIVAGNGEYVYAGGAKPTLNPSSCFGTLSSAGNNIVTPSNGSECVVNGSFSAADPLLGTLQNNGGPTQTYAIPSNSPAVDQGNPAGCTDHLGAPLSTDQRGYTRSGDRCDIGAFEYNGVAPATPTPSPSPSPTASPTPTLTASTTATPTATPTPSPTATATPISADLTQGDVNCDGDVDGEDVDLLLQFAAGLLDGTTPGTCPDLNSLSITSVGHGWGDVNCDDAVNALDALFVLAHQAQLELGQESGCVPIGSDFP
jgi:predicted outer membrane repeat protein